VAQANVLPFTRPLALIEQRSHGSNISFIKSQLVDESSKERRLYCLTVQLSAASRRAIDTVITAIALEAYVAVGVAHSERGTMYGAADAPVSQETHLA
jgi:hypothetical protein